MRGQFGQGKTGPALPAPGHLDVGAGATEASTLIRFEDIPITPRGRHFVRHLARDRRKLTRMDVNA